MFVLPATSVIVPPLVACYAIPIMPVPVWLPIATLFCLCPLDYPFAISVGLEWYCVLILVLCLWLVTNCPVLPMHLPVGCSCRILALYDVVLGFASWWHLGHWSSIHSFQHFMLLPHGRNLATALDTYYWCVDGRLHMAISAISHATMLVWPHPYLPFFSQHSWIATLLMYCQNFCCNCLIILACFM